MDISDISKSSSYKQDEKVVKTYSIIDNLLQNNSLLDKLTKFRQTLSKFRSNSEIGKKLDQQYISTHIIQRIRR
jgi:fructoselysine-6-P-deglycase FrlB-like protein